MADREDVELIAELVGKTSAHMKKIDGEIISSSANLQQSQDAWDPHKIVKDVIGSGPMPPDPVHQHPPAGVHPSVQQGSPPPPPQQWAEQAYVPPVMQPAPVAHTQPVVQVVTREFEDRLVQVEKKLDVIMSYMESAEKLDKKIINFVDRGLKDRVKQITLKLDDTKD